MSDIQKQIKDALGDLKGDHQELFNEAVVAIQDNAEKWLRHQQSIISQQAEEIERLKKENFEWKRTYDKLLLEANRNVNP